MINFYLLGRVIALIVADSGRRAIFLVSTADARTVLAKWGTGVAVSVFETLNASICVA